MRSITEFAKEALDEASRYKRFKYSVLRYFGVNSPEEMNDAKRKRFYKYVDKEWKRYKGRSARVNEDMEETTLPKMKIQSLEDFVSNSLNEEDDMLGASTQTLPPDELKAYLSRIKGGEKSKLDKYKKPYIHKGNIPIVNSETGEEFDLDALKADVTKRPSKILKQNEKITHSGGGATIYFNIGLPALTGLAVNEKTGDFVIVNTCPGAGACKIYCYARKGGYVMFKAASMSQTRLLNYLINDPNGFKTQMIGELVAVQKKFANKDVKIVVRWHDAGDFFSPSYLNLAYDIARQLPDIEFYSYTKIANVAGGEKPDNFLMNFSGGALPSQQNQVDFTKTKHSDVVPKELFSDLITKTQDGKVQKDAKGKYVWVQGGVDKLKDRMAKKYNINKDSIITYEEMMNIKQTSEPKYNVIVSSGDGDDSANRKDVLGTYLLIH